MTRTLLLCALAALALLAALLTACGDDPAPVAVYVTPTPDAGQPADRPQNVVAHAGQPNGAPLVEVSTAAPTAIAQAPTPTIPPGVTYGAIVGPGQPAAPTASPAPPLPTSTPAPGATTVPGVPYGPIVGPGHTLVPTETPVGPAAPAVTPTPGPSPTPGPALVRAMMGIQMHPHIDSREYDNMLRYAQELGVTWIKFQFNWSLLEAAPGQYTELFYMLRLYVQRAHDAGFRVLASVAKAPGWARSPGADGVMHEDGPPNDPQALASFLTGMLNQMGRDVYGNPYVSAVEVWNEPNLRREWTGRPLTGDDYMAYFRPAYSAVRAFSPQITVITAGPAPTGDSDWSTNDRKWLQQFYNAGLAQYGADVAVGVHPYAWANSPTAHCCANPGRGWDDQPQFFFLDTLQDYHQIMVANGHGGAQLWGTEFGWATFEGLRAQFGQGAQPPNPADAPYFGFINQAQQAQYTLEAFQLAQSLSYVGPMILWNLNFAMLGGAVDRSDGQTGYGLLDSAGNPRPIYYALQAAAKR